MLWIYILIFITSCSLLAVAGGWLVRVLSRISIFLKCKEFIVGFFLMAFATSIPNLFIGIVSAKKGIPQLSFGDIVGGNIFDLTIAIGLAAVISRAGLSAQSRTVQNSSIFTIAITLLPMLLIFDKNLSRIDGILLIFSFIFYIAWIFSKRERFEKTYENCETKISIKDFFKNLLFFIGGITLLLASAEGMVRSALFFSEEFRLPLELIGILVVGIGSALPETIFSLQAARKGQDWLILGDLMGGVIIISTVVLGIVALIHPIEIADFSPFAIGRIFLFLAAMSFFFFIKSGKKITKQEGLAAVAIYIAFVFVELLAR